MIQDNPVMENLGASSSLQQEGCAPAPDNSISAEEVYALLNARSPVIVASTVNRVIGAVESITRWLGKPVIPPIPIRVLRKATRAEYFEAGGQDSVYRPYYHEIESVD